MKKIKKYLIGYINIDTAEVQTIEYQFTKINDLWTNGQVERMNRTIKETTVKRYHYGSYDQLKEYLQTFLRVYNFVRRLKTLKGLTLYEEIVKWWQKEPHQFTINPLHQTAGLYA